MLRTDDLNPDGVRIVVNWDEMVTSSSIFVPCVNTDAAKEQIKAIAKDKGWEVNARTTIESGRVGLRVWRIT